MSEFVSPTLASGRRTSARRRRLNRSRRRQTARDLLLAAVCTALLVLAVWLLMGSTIIDESPAFGPPIVAAAEAGIGFT